MRIGGIIFVLLVLTGCATPVPDVIRTAPPTDIPLAQARENPEAYAGQRVRWGGTIANAKNGQTQTDLEVVGRDLTSSGRPRLIDSTTGRFIARVSGFLDPAVYEEGRQVTVVGALTETVTGRIGEHAYRYPVVKAETVHLWEPIAERSNRDLYYDPFYYDPFWYPWRPLPYYYYPHHRLR